MTKGFILLSFFLGLGLSEGFAQDGEGWCYANTKDNPKYPFGLMVAFTTELSARKNAGQITEADYDWAYAEIGKANQLFANNEPKAGCLLIEELELEYELLPKQ